MIIANSIIVGGLAYYLNPLPESSSVPTYDGTWWLQSTGMCANPYMELGRKTSLSPLETAKAFGAPLVRLWMTTRRSVKYGEASVSAGEGAKFLTPRKTLKGRLQFVEEVRARLPARGEAFGPTTS
jgi:hypothetical protein